MTKKKTRKAFIVGFSEGKTEKIITDFLNKLDIDPIHYMPSCKGARPNAKKAFECIKSNSDADYAIMVCPSPEDTGTEEYCENSSSESVGVRTFFQGFIATTIGHDRVSVIAPIRHYSFMTARTGLVIELNDYDHDSTEWLKVLAEDINKYIPINLDNVNL